MNVTLLLLSALLLTSPSKQVAAGNLGTCKLDFPAVTSVHCGPYIADLRPGPDVEGQLITLDLLLRKPTQSVGVNLVEPIGNWHGSQPFSFAAADFRNGAAHSIYGGTRRLPVQRSGKIIAVHVEDASLGTIRTWNGGRLVLHLRVLDRG